MKEIWKTINECPNYKVSNTGKVKSICRKVWNSKGYRTVSERILKPRKDRYGYFQVLLCNEGIKKNMYIHKLVAAAFIQNKDNLPFINHIDENKSNNNVENLEFCTHIYNCNYGTRNKRIAKTLSMPVKCLETGEIYQSTRDIERQFGFDHSHICACCNGKQKQAYGYRWEYV